MAQKLCDNCGKRPAKMFRVVKFRARPDKLVIKSSDDHPLCRQCHNANFERMRQEDMAKQRRRNGSIN